MGKSRGNSHGSRRQHRTVTAPAPEVAVAASAAAAKPATDPRKVSVYLPDTILAELRTEAGRQERSLSWLIQKSWRLAREEIKKLVL